MPGSSGCDPRMCFHLQLIHLSACKKFVKPSRSLEDQQELMAMDEAFCELLLDVHCRVSHCDPQLSFC